MVVTYLTENMIKAGEALVRALEDAGRQPAAAFWLYNPESLSWRLVISDELVGTAGPLAAYRRLQELLEQRREEFGGLTLANISLWEPDSVIVSSLRRGLRQEQPVEGMRLSNSYIEGSWIEDAYVYRAA